MFGLHDDLVDELRDSQKEIKSLREEVERLQCSGGSGRTRSAGTDREACYCICGYTTVDIKEYIVDIFPEISS